MIHLPVRLRTSWAKSSIAGLLALSLSASAGMVAASPVAVSTGPLTTAAASISAPVGTGAAHAFSLAASSAAIAPASQLTTTVAPTATTAQSARLQVAAQAKALVIASKTSAAPKATTVAPKKTVTVSYHGVYHLWIPALGLSRDIDDWGCNGGLIPNHVEEWGCVPKSNLYLLGHAWGVFAKIHDGYHSGALHVGLTAWYADKAGKVHKYRISWIRHVRNADYASWSQWAMAASSSQVITLQTCDGATSAYRILVRLVPA